MPWHTEPSQDLEARRQMINLIANFLEKRHPRTAEVQEALVSTARKLEVALYKACKTKQEYMETRTLPTRIRELERTGNFALETTTPAAATATTTAGASVNPPTSATTPNATAVAAREAAPGTGHAIAANVAAVVQAAAAAAAVPVASGSSSSAGTTPAAGSTAVVSAAAAAGSGTSTAQPLTQSDITKQRRTRLILLRHASKCVEPEGKCTNTWCPQMKKLWQHVSQCKSSECTVPHCVSSHFVLSHYSKCRDPDCEVCSPVRDPLTRNKLLAAKAAGLAQGAGNSDKTSSAVDGAKENAKPEDQARKLVNASGASVSAEIDKRFARGSRDGTGPSLPLSMTRAAVLKHMYSLKVELIQQSFMPLLRKLMEHSRFNPQGLFNAPVDEKDAPGYFKMINKPMDFGSIRRRLDDGKYSTAEEFEADVNQVFINAMTYNPKHNWIHSAANELKAIAEADIKKIKAKLADPSAQSVKKNNQCQLCRESQCSKCFLCDRGCLPYEPRILFCSAPNCGQSGTRIPRNGNFYSMPGSSLNWCSDCHDARKNDPHLVDVATGAQYNKSDLVKRKHDEVVPEPWVYCDVCEKWCHQTCALFNSRKQSLSNSREKYVCPKCLTGKEYPLANKVPGAEDLEHTRLSKFLEMWVRKKLGEAYAQDKQNPAKIRGEEPPPVSAVSIRVLSNFDETFPVKTYAKTVCGFPETLSYRSRAIFLFQHLDGVDVLLFVMYVQEYGSDAPPPNRGKIYIAYLDSVHFFRPRHCRTLVYHELLLAYLEYTRRLGFTSCYIWACPPATKRDDYILHCHPEDQRVPNAERLRMWYHEMIRRGVSEHIVLSSCALFEEHYDASFKKSTGGPKKKDSKKALADNKSKKGVASRQDGKMVPEKEIAAPSAFEDDDDDLLNDMFDDGSQPAPSMTPAPPPSTPGPDASSAATPSRRNSASPQAEDGPLFLGMRKYDMEVMETGELERRRSNKLAVRFQMPVFDGDYWPNEMEDVALDQAKRSREGKGAAGKGAKKAGAARRAGGEALTIEQLAASGEIKEIDPKTVLNRIGESLEAMRADFLVVKLAHECSICGKYLLRGRWECRHPDCLKAAGFNRPSPFTLCNDCFKLEIAKPAHMQHGQEAQLDKPVEDPGDVPSGASATDSKTEQSKDDDGTTADGSESGDATAAAAAAAASAGGAPAASSSSASASNGVSSSSAQVLEKQPVVTPEEMASWEQQPLYCTRSRPSLPSDGSSASLSHQLVYFDEQLPLVTPRVDKHFRNHLLDTRHAFLSLCTGNRYAFNQLRRAKHSTMMILYHLHNPEAPAHLRMCNSCNEDIIVGHRYNCPICQGGDFDLCETCYRSSTHEHKMTRFEVTRGVDQEMSENKRKKGMEKRRQRKRSLQIFLNALVHASSCSQEASECGEMACPKMKELLTHREKCTVRVRGGCEICRRVLCLVQMHAKGTENTPPCSLDKCPVPHCDDLKRHLRQRDADGGMTTPRPGGGGGAAGANGNKAKGRAAAGATTGAAAGAPQQQGGNPKKKQAKLDPSAPVAAASAQEKGGKPGGAGAKKKAPEPAKTPAVGGGIKLKIKLPTQQQQQQTAAADGTANGGADHSSTTTAAAAAASSNGTSDGEPVAKRMRGASSSSPQKE